MCGRVYLRTCLAIPNTGYWHGGYLMVNRVSYNRSCRSRGKSEECTRSVVGECFCFLLGFLMSDAFGGWWSRRIGSAPLPSSRSYRARIRACCRSGALQLARTPLQRSGQNNLRHTALSYLCSDFTGLCATEPRQIKRYSMMERTKVCKCGWECAYVILECHRTGLEVGATLLNNLNAQVVYPRLEPALDGFPRVRHGRGCLRGFALRRC